MNTPLNDLILQVDAAEGCLKLLEEIGASTEAVLAQRDRCRSLRRAMNAQCPDSTTYDPREGNIVEQPV